MAGDPVRVIYRKYDGTLHWNMSAYRLGEDGYGVWVGVPAGTPVRRGYEPPTFAEADHVVVLPPAGWWTGCFNAEPHPTEVYCDISTVPRWSTSDEVSMIDLDLDVRRRRTGEVELLDEDEFAAHRVRFDYPVDVIAAATGSAQALLRAVADREEPFGSAYRRWLAFVATVAEAAG